MAASNRQRTLFPRNTGHASLTLAGWSVLRSGDSVVGELRQLCPSFSAIRRQQFAGEDDLAESDTAVLTTLTAIWVWILPITGRHPLLPDGNLYGRPIAVRITACANS
jgi:hypothetical protein